MKFINYTSIGEARSIQSPCAHPLWTKGHDIISLLGVWASPERSFARLIVGIRVRILAMTLEIIVVLDAGWGTFAGSGERSAATIFGIARISIQVGGTRGFAAGSTMGTLLSQSGRAFRVEIEFAVRFMATSRWDHRHGDIESVN